MSEPGDDIELAAKATGEIVKALAEESGALEPVQQYASYIAGAIYYRNYPKLISRAMAAAEKIQQSGLPRRAFEEIPDPLLRAILVNAAEEEDPGMQERWENLLAQAVTVGSAEVKKAYPNMLSELEPDEAAQLDEFADKVPPVSAERRVFSLADADLGHEGLDKPCETRPNGLRAQRPDHARRHQYRPNRHQ